MLVFLCPTNSETEIHHRNSQLTVFDDNVNVLLLLDVDFYGVNYTSNPGPNFFSFFTQSLPNEIHGDSNITSVGSLYYTITDLISINFTKTISQDVWPTDGFQIKYYVNDFTNTSNNSYYLWLFSNDTSTTVNTSISLNVLNDHCICSETIYNCHNFEQHFDLKNELSIADNDINILRFYAIPDFLDNNFNPLILPQYITIQLQRCNISFEQLSCISTNDNPPLNFSYSLSPNCYSRNIKNFYVTITAPSLNMRSA